MPHVTLLLLVLVLSACRSSPARRQSDIDASPVADVAAVVTTKLPVELLSWWVRDEKDVAIPLWIRVHASHNSQEELLTPSASLSGNVRAIVRSRMLAREPPDLFQANAGSDLLQWVFVNGIDDRQSMLRALNENSPLVQEMRKMVPRVVMDSLSYGGKVYGAVGNIRRINTVFYNLHVFKKYKLALPKSPDDLLKVGKRLRAAGVPLMAVGSRDPWTVVLMVFESLVVAREGAEFYRDYFEGRLRSNDPRILAALRQALELSKYFNDDHGQLTWNQALERVGAGQAAMISMGDWAQQFFLSRNMRPGVDYLEAAFPGTRNDFVFTADAFAVPIKARNPEGAERALATLGSFELQKLMHVGRGTLAVRTDVAGEERDPVLREKYRLLAEGNLAIAMSGLVPSSFSEELAAAVAEMLQQHDIEPVVQMLRSRYPLLRR